MTDLNVAPTARGRAVGAYVFAGGFTLGMKDHFDVLAHLEDGDYGVATVQRNMPRLPVYTDPATWPLHLFKGVDLVYGNPPCAAWSANNPRSHQEGSWRTDPRVHCARRHFQLLEDLHPRLGWMWESVPRAATKGRELVDEFVTRAHELGYHTTEVLHDAQRLGTPQVRPRFMLCAHRGLIDWTLPFMPARTVEATLAGVVPRGGPAYDGGAQRKYLTAETVAKIRPGERLRAFWERTHPPETRVIKPNGHTKGRPGFGHRRLRANEVATATVGYSMLHPTEDRFLAINEVAVLAGFPDDYEIVGSGPDTGYSAELDLIARGVCPPVGSWFAQRFNSQRPTNQPPEHQQVDVR